MFISGQPQNQISEKRKLAFVDNHSTKLYDQKIKYLLNRKAKLKVKNMQQKTDFYKKIDRVHQVVPAQASEIANLQSALQSQGKRFKNQLSGTQQINEKLIADMERMQAQITRLQAAVPQPLTPIPSTPALIFRPPSPSISFHISEDVPNVNQKEVEKFLRLVAEGEQDKVEAMLKSNPAIALEPGNITDLSKRTFNGITGFQYAVWALDWHMWTMIREHLSDNAELEQAQGFETGAWVKTHGVHANLNILIQAYQTTIDLYAQKKWAEGNQAYVQQVGGAQRLLPAHVVNEYCHPTRPFYPLPNFKDAVALPRIRSIDVGEWFTASYNDGNLGDTFSCYRGGKEGVRANRRGELGPDENVRLWCGGTDHDSVCALNSTRIEQREALIAELRPGTAQRNNTSQR